jgi:hypothetical protein
MTDTRDPFPTPSNGAVWFVVCAPIVITILGMILEALS